VKRLLRGQRQGILFRNACDCGKDQLSLPGVKEIPEVGFNVFSVLEILDEKKIPHF